MFQALKQEKNTPNIQRNISSVETEKVYRFFIRFLGITIQIIKNPANSDFDNSKLIDAKESLFLGFALSLDSLCIGIGGSIIGINTNLFPFFISFFQLIFLSFGNWLGRKLNNFTHLPNNLWSIVSGFLLIFIGFLKLFVQ